MGKPKFLNELQTQLLREDTEEIPINIQKLLARLVYKEPFVAQLFGRGHTDWIVDTSIETAGVLAHQGRIRFYYNPDFIESLSDPELNFLLQHELYHIFRSHGTRAAGMGATTNRTHYLFNVANDALINADCEKDGGFGGLPNKMIKGGWLIAKRADAGSIQETWQKDDKDKYKDAENSEPLYKWMVERDKEAQKKQQQQQKGQPQKGQGQPQQGQGQGQGEPQPPWEPKIGDVVFNKKNNKYGKVSNIKGQKVEIEEVSEKEAEDIVSKEEFLRSKKLKHASLFAR